MDFPTLHNLFSQQPPLSLRPAPPLLSSALSESTTKAEAEAEEGQQLGSIIEDKAKHIFMRKTEELIDRLEKMVHVDDPQRISVQRVRSSPFIRHMRGSSDITNCIFTPQVISIGPYHHGKNCLAKMERHKSRFLEDFLCRDFSRILGHHQNKLKMIEHILRDDYETKFNLTSDQFIDMMILDGCFILELLIKIYNHTPDEILKNKSLLRYIKTDLLMIENQVPFLVLEILYDDPHKYGDPIPTINQLLAYYFWDIKDDLRRYEGCSRHSLLHSYHQFFIFPPLGDKKTILAEPKERKSTKFGVEVRSSPSIPSAQELEKIGVVFKAKKTANFLDITFHGKVLEMPVLSMDEPFLLLFINLVMFEIVASRDDIVKDYCYFMRYLLQYPDDVAVLRKHGIIKSHDLMTDKSLTDMFSRLNYFQLICGAQPLYFVGLMKDLMQFRDRGETTWHDILGYYGDLILGIFEFLWILFWGVLVFVVVPIIGLGTIIIAIVALSRTIEHWKKE